MKQDIVGTVYRINWRFFLLCTSFNLLSKIIVVTSQKLQSVLPQYMVISKLF